MAATLGMGEVWEAPVGGAGGVLPAGEVLCLVLGMPRGVSREVEGPESRLGADRFWGRSSYRSSYSGYSSCDAERRMSS